LTALSKTFCACRRTGCFRACRIPIRIVNYQPEALALNATFYGFEVRQKFFDNCYKHPVAFESLLYKVLQKTFTIRLFDRSYNTSKVCCVARCASWPAFRIAGLSFLKHDYNPLISPSCFNKYFTDFSPYGKSDFLNDSINAPALLAFL